jgi:hypothetical protein
MFLLRFRRRQRFGVGMDVPTYRSPIGKRPEDQRPFDPEDELLGCLQGGEVDDLPYADGEDPKWNERQP